MSASLKSLISFFAHVGFSSGFDFLLLTSTKRVIIVRAPIKQICNFNIVDLLVQ